MATEKQIAEINRDGTAVVLDDGSKWLIRIGDHVLVTQWHPAQRVLVEPKDRGVYHLHNLDTAQNDRVEADKFTPM
jgi:hypothetical protein